MANRLRVEKELDHMLVFLRKKMKEQGFSQVKVQAELGWKGSYISQLFNRTKALRVEQILLILDVIGVDPLEFYAEFYRQHGARHLPTWPREPFEPGRFELLDVGYDPLELVQESTETVDRFLCRFAEVRTLLRSTLHLLCEKGVFSLKELQEVALAIEDGMSLIQPSSEEVRSGQAPSEQAPSGQAPSGQAPSGQAPSEQKETTDHIPRPFGSGQF